MNRNEVIERMQKIVNPFNVTRIIDTGEMYVAYVCTDTGNGVFSAPYSLSYDGIPGRYSITDHEHQKKLNDGDVIYTDTSLIEARKRLLQQGYHL